MGTPQTGNPKYIVRISGAYKDSGRHIPILFLLHAWGALLWGPHQHPFKKPLHCRILHRVPHNFGFRVSIYAPAVLNSFEVRVALGALRRARILKKRYLLTLPNRNTPYKDQILRNLNPTRPIPCDWSPYSYNTPNSSKKITKP